MTVDFNDLLHGSLEALVGFETLHVCIDFGVGLLRQTESSSRGAQWELEQEICATQLRTTKILTIIGGSRQLILQKVKVILDVLGQELRVYACSYQSRNRSDEEGRFGLDGYTELKSVTDNSRYTSLNGPVIRVHQFN